MANYVSESIKDAVKSSMLEEAARPDSKLWAGDRASDSQHTVNGSISGSLNNHVNGSANNVNVAPDHVNNPISPARLRMLHDPLDEWFLERKPAGLAASPLTPETDPFILSKDDMQTLSQSIRTDLIGSDHPVLSKAASYFFEEGQDGGKKVRPMMVLLLSRAMELHTTTTTTTAVRPDLFQAQRRLAEISEMIHTASLFHDDVIDGADTRRGAPAVHKVFGNKMAILAGDYLLARASIFLARLRDVEVVETMSTIIEHLVRGEVMQMKGSNASDSENERMVQYLRKNFYKTASLMANSCKSAAILGGYSDEIVAAAYTYGKHLGIAFQLVDDVLDYDGSASAMGKPALSDLNAGLATAPVLFAAEMYSDVLTPLIDGKFKNEGDVDVAVEYVRKSNGIERTKDLAQVHVEIAIAAISEIGPSAYRDSLIHLAHKVVDRTR
jgi:solanesyl diphosphate synthase